MGERGGRRARVVVARVELLEETVLVESSERVAAGRTFCQVTPPRRYQCSSHEVEERADGVRKPSRVFRESARRTQDDSDEGKESDDVRNIGVAMLMLTEQSLHPSINHTTSNSSPSVLPTRLGTQLDERFRSFTKHNLSPHESHNLYCRRWSCCCCHTFYRRA